MHFLRWVKVWICLTTLTSLAGWSLSGLGQLNRTGYTVFFGLAAGTLVWRYRGAASRPPARGGAWKKWRRRIRRPLPGAFVALTLLILLGALLYPPTNHTAFTYRLPRVLNWLTREGWFWIHTPDWRLNDRACGIEWIATPLVLFTHSDRGMFLLNFLPYLMLPSLFFSVATGLGVRPRVAWTWMWLLPTGYNFLLQAGSAGNDTFPTVYALAAVAFALRAWTSRLISDLWFSILAAALLTGAKATNLPLLLPWAILVLPQLPRLRGRWLATLALLLLAATISYLPTAVLNTIHCGDWSGSKLEPAGETMHHPLIGIWGNALQILLDNLVPPFFPLAGWWNQHAPQILPHALVNCIETNFDTGYFWLGELPTEDWAGLGLGVSGLLTLSWVGASRARTHGSLIASPPGGAPARLRQLALGAAWISLLAYCVKSGLVTAARLISPYYFLLLPSLLLGAGQAHVVRRLWWRRFCGAMLIVAFAVLMVTPPRPLWPAQRLLTAALQAKPGNPWLTRALNVYAVYAVRSDPLAALRPLLPTDLKVVGFMGTPDDIDISLWRPYGSKRVEHVLLADTPAEIRSRGIDWVVVSGLQLEQRHTTLTDWLAQTGASLVATTNLAVKVSDGPQPWHIVRFRNLETEPAGGTPGRSAPEHPLTVKPPVVR